MLIPELKFYVNAIVNMVLVQQNVLLLFTLIPLYTLLLPGV